jgi:GNAT superfamily N-acetyltransferase
MTTQTKSYEIIQATQEHVNGIAPLFDAYRGFYGQPSNPEICQEFLSARINYGDTVVYTAVESPESTPTFLGFTILYPTFHSVMATSMWILNDIYVAETARRRGIAKALIECGRELALDTCAGRLSLETGLDNTNSHQLYEHLGFKREDSMCTYVLDIEP